MCAPYLCVQVKSTDSCRDLGSLVPLKPLKGPMDFSFSPKDPLFREQKGLRPRGTDTANAWLSCEAGVGNPSYAVERLGG